MMKFAPAFTGTLGSKASRHTFTPVPSGVPRSAGATEECVRRLADSSDFSLVQMGTGLKSFL